MSDIREVSFDGLRKAIGSMCLGKAGLAEGTNANTIKTVTTVPYSINGRLYSKAATDNIAMNALAAQAALKDCMYLVLIDSAGTVSLAKGTEVANGAGAVLPANPAPTTRSVLGAFKVATAAATTFTSGTTDLSAAGVVATFYDMSHAVPDIF
jgi:hypothetical protein